MHTAAITCPCCGKRTDGQTWLVFLYFVSCVLVAEDKEADVMFSWTDFKLRGAQRQGSELGRFFYHQNICSSNRTLEPVRINQVQIFGPFLLLQETNGQMVQDNQTACITSLKYTDLLCEAEKTGRKLSSFQGLCTFRLLSSALGQCQTGPYKAITSYWLSPLSRHGEDCDKIWTGVFFFQEFHHTKLQSRLQVSSDNPVFVTESISLFLYSLGQPAKALLSFNWSFSIHNTILA